MTEIERLLRLAEDDASRGVSYTGKPRVALLAAISSREAQARREALEECRRIAYDNDAEWVCEQIDALIDAPGHVATAATLKIAKLEADHEAVMAGQRALADQTVRIRRALCGSDEARFTAEVDTEEYAKGATVLIESLRELLREHEWEYPEEGAEIAYCLTCHRAEYQGHAHDCRLHLLLPEKE